jgi:hypothetical protein
MYASRPRDYCNILTLPSSPSTLPSQSIGLWVCYNGSRTLFRHNPWSRFLPLMKEFCEQQQCSFAELAWYYGDRLVHPTDRPALVSISH